MGLHVTSIAEVVDKTEHIRGVRYFVYFLNYYQISDEIVDAFIAELPDLEAEFSRLGNALLVSSVKNKDFYNDVLSWHNVTGLDPEVVCPCLFICTIPPAEFKQERDIDQQFEARDNEPWIILKLGIHCKTTQDLRHMLKRVISAFSSGTELKEFEENEIFRYNDRPIITGALEFHGLSFDFRAAMNKAKRCVSKALKRRPAIYDEDE